jgi:hypothetical protein
MVVNIDNNNPETSILFLNIASLNHFINFAYKENIY